MLLTCPHCHRKNRLPPARLDQQPHCGACKQLLFTGTPLELDDQSFASHAGADLPLVIDFWAPWCGPCRQFAPVFQQAAPLVEPRARLVKVNTEQAQGLAARFA
ncbi:MAG: thiol reductase thioredoxin, partial [Pseudomonadales bacterium 32-61-5]